MSKKRKITKQDDFRDLITELYSESGRSIQFLTPDIVDAIRKLSSRQDAILFFSKVLNAPKAQLSARSLGRKDRQSTDDGNTRLTPPERVVFGGTIQDAIGERAFSEFVKDAPANGIYGSDLIDRLNAARKVLCDGYTDQLSGQKKFNRALARIGIKAPPRKKASDIDSK
ncbi:hypothetical protein ACNHKD_04225 [Methylocystis sp. JAN1]|uniref:hypothetical protein n=1 Tax=Methylocystis sp. JAN1 TaxID=3397211 RepID=UPI003FA26604